MSSDNSKKRAGPQPYSNGGGASSSPSKRRKRDAAKAAAGACSPDPGESPRPSLSIKTLVLPEDVEDLSPKSEGVVWAELRRCTSGGDGGRLSIENVRKSYQITWAKAGSLMSIVDLNLAEAGMEARKKRKTRNIAVWTTEEEDIVVKAVKEEMKQTGKQRMRPGFWNRLANDFFPERAKDAVRQHWNKLLKHKEGAATNDTNDSTDPVEAGMSDEHSNVSDVNENDEESKDGGQSNMKKARKGGRCWSDEDDEVLRSAVKEEMKKTGEKKDVRQGFWKRLADEFFPERTPAAVKLHWHTRVKPQLTNDTADAFQVDRINELNGSTDDNEGDEESEDDGQSSAKKAREGEHFWTDDDDDVLFSAVSKEMKQAKRARPGFWERLTADVFPWRTPRALKSRWSAVLKSSVNGKGLSEGIGLGSEMKEQRDRRTESEDEPMVDGVAEDMKHSSSNETEANPDSPEVVVPDAASVPDHDLIILPDYQAARATFPPGSLVIHCPLEGAGTDIKGTVKEVGLFPSRDLLVYTIVDEHAGIHKKVPEHSLKSASTSR